jgi:elongation factor G
VAVAKVDDIHFDAVLHDAAEDDHIHLKALDFPKPVHGLAIEPKRHGDEQRMWEILTKLVDEDPCLKVEHVANTNETIVYGLGELHLRVLLDRLRDVYKFEVNTSRRASPTARPSPARPKATTATRSRPAAPASSARSSCASSRCRAAAASSSSTRSRAAPSRPVHPGRRKGRARGAGRRRGGRLPGGGRARHRLRRQAPQRGQQGDRLRHRRRKAFMAAIREARPIVLEPIVHIEITAPDSAMGDITGDLSSKRGLVTGSANANGSSAPGYQINR